MEREFYYVYNFLSHFSFLQPDIHHMALFWIFSLKNPLVLMSNHWIVETSEMALVIA